MQEGVSSYVQILNLSYKSLELLQFGHPWAFLESAPHGYREKTVFYRL